MTQLVADCPRCRASSTTFDVRGEQLIDPVSGWTRHETFCVCRNCHKSTVFVLQQFTSFKGGTPPPPSKMESLLSQIYTINGFVSLKDTAAKAPPEHLPVHIDAAFREGAACAAIGCPNAAAAMFRLCVDHATKGLLPQENVDGLTPHIRKNLSPRLAWLFDNHRMPEALRDLSSCIKDDGNDGVHDGTLGKIEAEDLQDFAFELLERLYTEPARLALAAERRVARRAGVGR